MFINETGGWDGSQQDLFLLQAIPRCWLRPNDRLSLRDMGTYFGGKVGLEVAVAPDAHSVQVNTQLSLVAEPARLRMRLRSGDGRPLKSATVNGQAVAEQGGDVIVLPQRCTGKYQIVECLSDVEETKLTLQSQFPPHRVAWHAHGRLPDGVRHRPYQNRHLVPAGWRPARLARSLAVQDW
jgi:hypothetical protein